MSMKAVDNQKSDHSVKYFIAFHLLETELCEKSTENREIICLLSTTFLCFSTTRFEVFLLIFFLSLYLNNFSGE